MQHSRYFFSSRMETLPFSYIWFKYDILSLAWYKMGSGMVRVPNCKPTLPGLTPAGGANVLNGRLRGIDRYGKHERESFFFLLQNLSLQLGLGQRCQSEGIAIPCSNYS